MNAIPSWRLDMDYIESCNCNFGCPCNFNGYPTDGYCHTMAGYHIHNGHYGDVDLTGTKLVMAASWPGAIHQGQGTVRLHIDKTAHDGQRAAIMEIFSGRAGGNGPFAVFADTFSRLETPSFTDIDMVINGRNSAFRIAGVLEVELEDFVNPVTGEAQDVQIHMPQGFIFKTALAAKTRVMRLLGLGPLSFDHTGQNAFFAQVSYAGP